MQTAERINLRTTHERKRLISTAASYTGTSLSAFLLDAAEARAKQVMQEQTSIQLTVADWEVFARLLDEPETKPRPKLAALLETYTTT